MEHSSPLAAMQPPSVLFGHCFRAEPTSYPSLSGFGQNSFNFKDLSMKKSSSDYFSMKPVRGSSPTASLAADLSQNFHIDQRWVFVNPSCIAGRTMNNLGTSLLTLLLAHSWQRPVGLCSHPTFLDRPMDMVRMALLERVVYNVPC